MAEKRGGKRKITKINFLNLILNIKSSKKGTKKITGTREENFKTKKSMNFRLRLKRD